MTVEEIQELIKFVSKSGVSEVEIEQKDFKINIKTPPFRRSRGNKQGIDEQQNIVGHVIPNQIPMQQVGATMVHPAAPTSIPQAAVEAKSDSIGKDAGESDVTENYLEIRSPMIGTFYRKPSPDKAEFVKVGDTVNEGETVCVIEAMKLFNDIESEVSGKIVKVLVDDSTPVEYDQVLFLVDPKG
ncbi:MAG: acetyl-CoA carboxylase, biotin carboxyl carrier protein [Verrucomicrobia bacterium]|nr:acetyl-CoA carboxylase, biotin carboxyl carrier protein [Verrucomicrobiota bacterium]